MGEQNGGNNEKIVRFTLEIHTLVRPVGKGKKMGDFFFSRDV